MIIGGSNAALNVGGNRPDAVGLARQVAEKLDQFRVRALADITITCQQGSAFVVIKTLIGPQKLKKISKAAFEACFTLNLLHFRSYALDFT